MSEGSDWSPGCGHTEDKGNRVLPAMHLWVPLLPLQKALFLLLLKEAAESGKEGAQNITKGNSRREDEQPRERTQEKGGKGKTFTVALGHSVKCMQR